jgi:hypothetical protein
MPDLEIWLVGTPTQLDTAMTALAHAGRITAASNPEPLYHTDTGRTRRYLHLHITPTATNPVASLSRKDTRRA